MNAVDGLGFAAATSGIAMGTAPLLQARTIWIRRSSADVSQHFLWIILLGATLWLAYGVASRNLYLVVPNAVAVVTNALTLRLARRFAEPATR
jgi:uncharacterized protein with PQ loop repeat